MVGWSVKMNKKIISITLIFILSITIFSGCVNEDKKDPDTKTFIAKGVIVDTYYTAGASNSWEKTAVLFDDDSVIIFYYGDLLELYLLTKNNIGNEVLISYQISENTNRKRYVDFEVI